MNNRQFLIVISITFIVIIIWIIADILHTKPSIEVNPKLTTLLTPVDPNFDSKVISQIKDLTSIDDLQTTDFKTISVSTSSAVQPKITPNQTPLPLPDAIIASFSAIPGGNR